MENPLWCGDEFVVANDSPYYRAVLYGCKNHLKLPPADEAGGMGVASAAQGVHSRRGCGKIPFEFPIHPKRGRVVHRQEETHETNAESTGTAGERVGDVGNRGHGSRRRHVRHWVSPRKKGLRLCRAFLHRRDERWVPRHGHGEPGCWRMDRRAERRL